MRLNKMLIPVGALAIALGTGGLSAEAAQRAERRDRNGRQSQGQAQARERSGDARDQGNAAPAERRSERDSRGDGRDQRDQRDQRASSSDTRGGDRDRRSDNRARPSDRNYRYNAPRLIPRRVVRPHYYGSGGNLSVYFGWGSGYRYGSPYSGRVYGLFAPSSRYDTRRYYGDVRLQVRPRDAAVYVDGYYAGLVDDFDGVFQRLTLEVGPHQIEIEAPGLEPQVFDVYVDPSRTVDLRGDLFPGRP